MTNTKVASRLPAGDPHPEVDGPGGQDRGHEDHPKDVRHHVRQIPRRQQHVQLVPHEVRMPPCFVAHAPDEHARVFVLASLFQAILQESAYK